jgi:septum formation protein
MLERAGSATERSPLVLASASPRRSWLLAKLGIPFTVRAVAVAEQPHTGEAPAPFAERMAREKAAAAAARAAGSWVLAADTVVAVDARALGKPRDAADATAMLLALAGRAHTVYTAVALVRPDGTLAESLLVGTEVAFRPLAPREVEAYVATGEPFDKAGAYAIQGEGAHLVDRIHGSYTNVIGLPLAEVASCLAKWQIA